ncbi:DNA-binding response regulator [Deinococcus seoulensis]|uniref:DNA-binding response regulator n=1 Tax=Deinococcus seoulensis TaxID=1837379 RepID=A0ABQ2RSY4_9DEIO|nr:response regulator transcription factor [Deinococcus seoulensis]GGR58622.1 DNA-binding response regulator [Deinococcus seoulensis]
MPTRILIVTAEPTLQAALQRLTAHGYQVKVTHSVPEARLALGTPAALVIMGADTPDAVTFTRFLSARPVPVPSVILGCGGELNTTLTFMQAGAVAYIQRPCAWRELLARIRSLLRVHPGCTPVQVGGLTLLPAAGACQMGGREVSLTATEFRLLVHLAGRAGERCQRQDVLKALWDTAPAPRLATLNTHLSRLRAKLRELTGGVDLIHMPQGSGVVFEVPPNLHIPELMID